MRTTTMAQEPIQAAIVLLERFGSYSESITIKQALVFCTVVAEGGDCRLEDITRALKSAQGVASKWVQKLRDMGLLQKELAPGSERDKIISLTQKGKELARLIGMLGKG